MSWMFYDDEFRRLNNGNPATPWSELHTELYLRAYKTETDKSVRANRPFPPKSNRQQQTGMCWESKNNAGVCKRFNCPFLIMYCFQYHFDRQCEYGTHYIHG